MIVTGKPCPTVTRTAMRVTVTSAAGRCHPRHTAVDASWGRLPYGESHPVTGAALGR
jgi:hypothetical protein